MARLLVKASANPDWRNSQGTTALMAAAREGHEEVVRLLLEAGADTGFVDNAGDTALLHASRGGHAKIAHLLSAKRHRSQ